MKNKKLTLTIIICIVVIALLVGGLYWYDTASKKKSSPATNPDGSDAGSGTPTGTRSVFPLKIGSKGTEVEVIQTKMNIWMAQNFDSLLVKPKYQNGIRAGQPMKSIVVDGEFGVNTQEFCLFVYRSKSVTESQYLSGTPSGWGGGVSGGSGSVSGWTEPTGFEKFGLWIESLFN
jgi:hypothetical protein